MAFSSEFTVRFGQVDLAGVVYFSRAFEVAHEAYEELMLAMGMPVAGVLAARDWGMPLVHVDADYHHPWRLGETIRVEVASVELGRRTVRFNYAFYDPEGVVRTEVCMRHAFVAMDTFESCRVPDAFRVGLARVGLLGS
jgi:acyl-CoA thioesterase FadM